MLASPALLYKKRFSFTYPAAQKMVPTVKDPSSDFALCARNGSATLRHQREKREKGKMRQRFWELGGSRMGKAMGVADDAGTVGDTAAEGESKGEVRGLGGLSVVGLVRFGGWGSGVGGARGTEYHSLLDSSSK